MSCPSYGISASAAAIATCQRHLSAIGAGCSSRWAVDCVHNGHPISDDRDSMLRPGNVQKSQDTISITNPRRPYAVRPLGELPPLRDVPPPACAQPIEIANHFHVTNLGTLLDVLA